MDEELIAILRQAARFSAPTRDPVADASHRLTTLIAEHPDAIDYLARLLPITRALASQSNYSSGLFGPQRHRPDGRPSITILIHQMKTETTGNPPYSIWPYSVVPGRWRGSRIATRFGVRSFWPGVRDGVNVITVRSCRPVCWWRPKAFAALVG